MVSHPDVANQRGHLLGVKQQRRVGRGSRRRRRRCRGAPLALLAARRGVRRGGRRVAVVVVAGRGVAVSLGVRGAGGLLRAGLGVCLPEPAQQKRLCNSPTRYLSTNAPFH